MVAMPQEPKRKFHWKKVLVTTLTVVTLVWIFIGALYWYISSNNPEAAPALKQKTATGSVKKATPSAEPKESKDDATKNWKTFSIAELSFRYPSGWVKVGDLDNSDKSGAESGEIWERTISFQKTSGKDVSGVINIYIANNPSGSSTENFVNDRLDSLFIGKEAQATSDLKIDSKETLKLVYPASPQAYGLVSYVIGVDKKIYEFEYTVVTGMDSAVPKSEYETIFSTIEIT
jgi:hypothetical protein